MKVVSAGPSLLIDTSPVSLWLQSIRKQPPDRVARLNKSPLMEAPWQVRVLAAVIRKQLRRMAADKREPLAPAVCLPG